MEQISNFYHTRPFFGKKIAPRISGATTKRLSMVQKIFHIFLYLQGLSLDFVADRAQRDCSRLFCSFVSSHQFSFKIKHFCWRQKIYFLASCPRISVNCSCTCLQLTYKICKLFSWFMLYALHGACIIVEKKKKPTKSPQKTTSSFPWISESNVQFEKDSTASYCYSHWNSSFPLYIL